MAEKKTTEDKTVEKVPATKESTAKTTPKKPAAKSAADTAAPKEPTAAKTAASKTDEPSVAKAEKLKPGKTVKVTLVKSVIGTKASHRATVRGLGLRRIRHSVELEDTPSVRGMINKVNYLVRVEA
jgi:large subunit ribosomal protein L30